MRSTLGFAAALTFLLALPVAALVDGVLGGDGEAAVHFVWAVGFVQLAIATSAFGTPSWIAWVGRLSSGALAVVFVLQGISNLVPNKTLHQVAFPLLGSTPEHVLVDLLLGWFVGLLLTDSQGVTKALGWTVMALALGTEVVEYLDSIFSVVPMLKLVLLLPFVWLLCESAKKAARKDLA